MSVAHFYSGVARKVAHIAGRPATFVVALTCIILWIASGPLFDFSDTWQLVINTATTIVTFLMVFLIQSTQNRDTEAIHLKLDELIRVTQGAQNSMLDLEEIEEKELHELRKKYGQIAQQARASLYRSEGETDVPDL